MFYKIYYNQMSKITQSGFHNQSKYEEYFQRYAENVQ